MRSLNALATPEFVLVQFNALRISSQKSLGNVCVVQTLAIAETGETQGDSESESKDDSAGATVEVHVGLERSGLACKIAVGESSTEESAHKSRSTS